MRYRTSSLTAAIAAVALLVTACGTSAPGSGEPTGPSKPLIAVAGVVADNLDPDPLSIASSQLSYQESTNYMGKLMEFSGANKADDKSITLADVVPEIAQSVTPSTDGLTYKFILKDGVKSYAGNTLTSADVAWTLQRAVATKGFASLLMTIGNVNLANPITVIDPKTFDINMSKPSGILEAIFAQGTLGIIDSVEAKKHLTEKDPWAHDWLAKNTASFGAYKVTAFDPGNQVTMAANEDYVEGAPKLKQVVWKQVTHPAGRTSLVKGGSANFGYQGALSDYASLAKGGEVNARLIDVTAQTVLLMNQTRAPFDNKDVRRALLLALDRQAIANAILPAAGKENNTCVPEGLANNNFKHFPAAQNVEEAKKVLAGAGFANGFSFTLTLSAASGAGDAPDIARFIQTQLKAIGVDMKIDTIATQPDYLKTLTDGSSDAFLSYQTPFIPDAAYYLNGFVFSKSPFFPQAFLNGAADANIVKAMSTSGTEREQAVLDACAAVVDATSAIPIMQEPIVYVLGKNVSGVKDYPNTIPVFKDMFVS